MTWTLSLQLFLTQQDLWTSAPTGTSSKDLTTLVSQLWLQGNFCNLTPDEIDFFTLILYIILHPNKQCSSSDSNHHQLGAFSPSPSLASPCLSNYNSTLKLNPCCRPSNCLPQDWPPSLRLSVGIAYVASCVLLLGCYFLRTA